MGIQIDSLISRLYVVSDSDYKILLPFANLVASLAAFNSLFLRPTNPTSENPAYKLWGLAAIIFSSLQSFVSHKEQPHKDTAKTASEFETVLDTGTIGRDTVPFRYDRRFFGLPSPQSCSPHSERVVLFDL